MKMFVDGVQVVLAYVLYIIGFVINLGAVLLGRSRWDPATNSLKYRTGQRPAPLETASPRLHLKPQKK